MPHHANALNLEEGERQDFLPMKQFQKLFFRGNLIIFNPSSHKTQHVYRILSDDHLVLSQNDNQLPFQRKKFANDVHEAWKNLH